jgi:hypothetical protein
MAEKSSVLDLRIAGRSKSGKSDGIGADILTRTLLRHGVDLYTHSELPRMALPDMTTYPTPVCYECYGYSPV